MLLFAGGIFPGVAWCAAWVVREEFGISHPGQVVRLPSVGRSVTAVRTSDGKLMAAQTLRDGRVAVRGDLPAGKVEQWTVADAAPPDVANAVIVQRDGDDVVLENGLVGIRLGGVVEAAGAGPAIRAIRWGSGNWQEATGGSLVVGGGEVIGKSIEVRESGPLVGEVVVRYEIERTSGENPGAAAFYHCTVTIEAGEPVIGFEEESDIAVRSRWDLDGFVANQARYRGGSSTRPEHGRLADGSRYPPSHARAGCDAFLDLRFDRPFESGFQMRFPDENTDEPGMIKRVSGWDVAVVDGGWYWQVYDRGGGPESALLGIFAGRPSRLIEPGESGAGLHTMADDGSGGRVGLTSQIVMRSGDGRESDRVRFGWNLFLGTKADLGEPDQFQRIGGFLNRHSGINLTKLASWQMDFPDPPGGYGALYLAPSAVQAVRERINDPAARAGDEVYGDWVRRTEAASPELWKLWSDPSEKAAEDAAGRVLDEASRLMRAFVEGDGIYQLGIHYWHGGLAMQRQGIIIDQLLADPRIQGNTRRRLKAAAAFFAYVLWDNDFVPMENHEGINLGTPNMPVQQSTYRFFYALMLAGHPHFQKRAEAVAGDVRKMVRHILHPDGVPMGSPHYIGASLTPTFNLVMRLERLGLASLVREELRMPGFGEFYLNLLTPSEPRRGGLRSLVVLGDGPIEGSSLLGQAGTALAGSHPDLSARLMQAWDETGRVHSNFFGTSVLAIDDDLPRAALDLQTRRFPGYLTVLRSAAGTPDETAVWVVDGEFYRDHRHEGDRGSLAVYALGAPLVSHWAAFYTPAARGSFFKPAVLTEDMIGRPWDKPGPPTNTGDAWSVSEPVRFVDSPEAAMTEVVCSREQIEWTRRVSLIRTRPEAPLIVVEDSISDDSPFVILSWPLEMTGPVKTPLGVVEPPSRSHPRIESPDHLAPIEYLPSATPAEPLKAGSAQFRFQGGFGIGCDVIVSLPVGGEYSLGNWEVDLGEHKQSQNILRIRTRGSVTTVLAPFRVPGDQQRLNVERWGDGLRISRDGETFHLSERGVQISGQRQNIFHPWTARK